MKKITSWVRNFFGFSRRETNAFLILLPLMAVLIFSEPAYRYWYVRQPDDYSKESKELDSLLATWKWEKNDVRKDSVSVRKPQSPAMLFLFDPNQSSKADLLKLGFNNLLATRIVNFKAKGGKFLVKNDLMKIYGMDSLFFRQLIPYINLPENILKSAIVKKIEVKEKPVFAKFDLNLADTSQFKKIYGIGTKLSLRIVAYREKLGGFTSGQQVSEVYGLDSAVVKELLSKSFVEENFKPALLNLNKSTEKELAAHPYIKYKLAKAIVAYRAQHKSFNSINELEKITIIDENTFQKIRPYLSIEP